MRDLLYTLRDHDCGLSGVGLEANRRHRGILIVGTLGLSFMLVCSAGGVPASEWLEPETKWKWLTAYDFDGDRRSDRIDYDFSGGAHCCYRLKVHLSSRRKVVKVPFMMDGGYVGGLDLSMPDHFTIRKPDGGLPELLMEIDTHNGEPLPLDHELMRYYGFNTHLIAVCFAGGHMQIRDQTPQLPPCRE